MANAMAKNKDSWSDMSDVRSHGNDAVDLEPSEFIIGQLITREVEGGPFEKDRLTLIAEDSNVSDVEPGDVVRYHAGSQVTRQLDEGGIDELETIGVKKTEETDSFEDDDGEKVEYNYIDVKVADDSEDAN